MSPLRVTVDNCDSNVAAGNADERELIMISVKTFFIGGRSAGAELVYRKFPPITCRPQICGLTRRQLISVSPIVAIRCSNVTPLSA